MITQALMYEQLFFPNPRPTSEKTKALQAATTGLILWGGEDISPSIYKEKSNSYCGAANVPSARDRQEIAMVEQAVKRNIPIIGVCRGAQLLCAIAGGSLVQHVEGHAIGKNHLIVTHDGRELTANSLHHQMMDPRGSKHIILATTVKKLSPVYLRENDEFADVPVEPEVVFFPQLNALAIQPHPEMMNIESEFVQWCGELIQKYFPGAFTKD